MPIHLCIVNGCFHATKANLSSCISNHGSKKTKLFTTWIFLGEKKKLLTTVTDQGNPL